MTLYWTLIALFAAHFFLDYAGQGDFMARAKNRTAPIPGVPFWQPLTAHAFLHGAAAGAITGLWAVVLAEAVAHWLIDDAKCRNRIGYNTDQALHLLCKVGWAGLTLLP
jgi:hypothetical protein